MKRHASSTRRQGGFTLVEIAIVLMIVGLLIGGILRGQELIQSARVRNIIDQKSAIQTAYIGFLDRYRMLPGDLTVDQAKTVGNSAQPGKTGSSGDGVITLATESTLFFQNLTASGFLSCGGCMTVVTSDTGGDGPAPDISNSPINVYGTPLSIGHLASNTAASATTKGFDWFDEKTVTRLVMATGSSIPSQVMAEVDRKADDGLPGTGQLRFAASGSATLTNCAKDLSATALKTQWANPSQANCQGAWLF
ncbi:prepilin-type N-terminal cleavage/methylation domain-containing protein [Polaromonas sp. CF318]|uniref:type II secretion system protein n=1 Tax=Polaromonas sp. CF318 TaxID=1144318 RepID=UPI0002713502|nr:type II secretion system protein [Polaromonas sp. CF318]EJL89923.1 prepilin-type N-terminal cleavage/methylation domain-containing protein [Polaromonas sp. CF318]